jgi:LPPG:FO 2-phospho-L-lactate transferase
VERGGCLIAVLSGGTGTPKLLWGMKEVFSKFFVVVNTAEDIWVSGNRISPDIDSVIYALSDIIDTEKWWGMRDDTFITHNMLKDLGFDERMMVGDRDRAVHIIRSEFLRGGDSLLTATKKLKSMFGIKQDVFPMCNEDVSTFVATDRGKMHFQEFWVVNRGEPEVMGIDFRGIDKARMPDEVEKSLKKSKIVLIGPSNPVTSIGPILAVKGYKEILRDKKVVAISPIIGRSPVSGPAGKFMASLGFEVSPRGVADIYGDILDVLVVDERDEDYEIDSVEVLKANTLMRDKDSAIKLSEFILDHV